MNGKDREKIYLDIQEKNDHYLLYIVVGGLYFSFFIYEKIDILSLRTLFILALELFVCSVVLFVISRFYSRIVAEEEARKKSERNEKLINKLNNTIVGLDRINYFLVILACILDAVFFVVNLLKA